MQRSALETPCMMADRAPKLPVDLKNETGAASRDRQNHHLLPQAFRSEAPLRHKISDQNTTKPLDGIGRHR